MEVASVKKYANPPIQEAICEIHFERTQPMTPGDFEVIQPVWFSNYPQQEIVAEKSFEFEFSVQQVNAHSKEIGHKLIARSADGKHLSQLGPRFLAVNRLGPYIGWEEEFRGTILARWQEVQTSYAFTAINRIGLRYINKIDIEQNPLDWSEWFAVPLPIPAAIPNRGGHFQSHFRQSIGPDIEAILNFGVLSPHSPGWTSVLLDIDVIWKGTAPAQQIDEFLEHVHQPHRSIFEGYLLDRCRNLFQS
ncbi:MAG: TIGR04255 family protein [Verrucomicrobiota bacterium]|jgi:uncharacterized protein (TIGR04255 family)